MTIAYNSKIILNTQELQQNMETTLTGKPLKRFFRLLSLERREISHIYLYAIFSGLIYLSLPLGIQAIISLVLANELSSSWVLLVAVVTLGTLVVGGLQLMQISITEMIQQQVFARASLEIAYRIPRIKMEALTKYYPPELVNRFFDILTIQKGLPKILIDLSTATLQILFGLILLSFYHAFFVLFGLVLVFILFLIFRFTGPRGLVTSLEESDQKYQVAYWLEEVARTLSSFKLAGNTDLALKKTDQLVSNYLDARKAHFRVLIFQFGNIVVFKTIVTAGLLLLGSILLIQRELNVGQFVASEIIIILVINSVEKLILSMETIYDVLTAVEKVAKITDMPLERHDGRDFSELTTADGIALKLQELNFKFPGEHKISLNEISVEIAAGSKICVAGESGSGKSTLLSVLSGLYESYEGAIVYNEIPLTNLNKTSLRSYIGDCLSQKNLFRGSIMENITMGRPEITLSDVMWSLERVGLTRYMQSLSEGLDSQIVPESPQMPQGISRKLILARCLAKRPQLLVMDDFFSIWEYEERKRLCEFLTCDEMQTVIAVSNEAAYASRCDQIIVLDQGRIVAMDSYEEICSKEEFANLFQ